MEATTKQLIDQSQKMPPSLRTCGCCSQCLKTTCFVEFLPSRDTPSKETPLLLVCYVKEETQQNMWFLARVERMRHFLTWMNPFAALLSLVTTPKFLL